MKTALKILGLVFIIFVMFIVGNITFAKSFFKLKVENYIGTTYGKEAAIVGYQRETDLFGIWHKFETEIEGETETFDMTSYGFLTFFSEVDKDGYREELENREEEQRRKDIEHKEKIVENDLNKIRFEMEAKGFTFTFEDFAHYSPEEELIIVELGIYQKWMEDIEIETCNLLSHLSYEGKVEFQVEDTYGYYGPKWEVYSYTCN